MKSLAIVGGGALADGIVQNLSNEFDIKVFTHKEFDITDQTQCDAIIPALSSFDCILITVGQIGKDVWGMWMTNCVGPCYLVAQLNEHVANKKIVVVSSYAARWTSWPGVETGRMTYSMSKNALSNFILGLTQQGLNKNQLTVFEPSVFQSKMSGHKGTEVTTVVEQIRVILSNSMHVVSLTVK